MNNTSSIETLVNIFRDLALQRHLMIKGFGYGELSEVGVQSKLKFPFLWVQEISSRVAAGNTPVDSSMIVTFDIHCYDKIAKGDSNDLTVTSDTNYILNTIVADLKRSKYYRDLQLSVLGDVVIEPRTRQFDEDCNGWCATISLVMPFRYTAGNIPITQMNGYTFSFNGTTTRYQISGNQGPQGATGAMGYQGYQGVQGFQGSQGLQGTQGNQGVNGTIGLNGATGSQGNQGVQGTQGYQGAQGAQGNQGTQGNQGYQGVQGFTGSQGAQGNQGVQGTQGYQGNIGAIGFQGSQGAQGVQGFQGIAPATSSFYLNGGNSFGATASIGLNDNYNLRFLQNAIERMRLTTGGSLLINTATSSSYKLDVDGTAIIRNALIADTDIGISKEGQINSMRVSFASGVLGYGSLYVGYYTGAGNIGQNYETYLGSYAGAKGGGSNTAVGTFALGSLNGGSSNTALGVLSGQNVTTGISNVFLGVNSGSAILDGSYNVITGAYQASSFTNSSNNIFLADGQGNLRIRIPSTGNVLINTTTDAGYKLDINGTTRHQSTTLFKGTASIDTYGDGVANTNTISNYNNGNEYGINIFSKGGAGGYRGGFKVDLGYGNNPLPINTAIKAIGNNTSNQIFLGDVTTAAVNNAGETIIIFSTYSTTGNYDGALGLYSKAFGYPIAIAGHAMGDNRYSSMIVTEAQNRYYDGCLSFFTNPTNVFGVRSDLLRAMQIDGDQNVGIGISHNRLPGPTYSPKVAPSKLYVISTTTSVPTSQFCATISQGTNISEWLNSSATTIAYINATGSMYVSNNIQIGTTTTNSYKLYVNGTGYFNSDLYVNSTAKLIVDTLGVPSYVSGGSGRVNVYGYNGVSISGNDITISAGNSFVLGGVGSDNYLTGAIAIGKSSSPDSKSILELYSTTKGFLPPKMTTTQRNNISSPTEGLIVYDTDIHKLYCYDSATWSACW